MAQPYIILPSTITGAWWILSSEKRSRTIGVMVQNSLNVVEDIAADVWARAERLRDSHGGRLIISNATKSITMASTSTLHGLQAAFTAVETAWLHMALTPLYIQLIMFEEGGYNALLAAEQADRNRRRGDAISPHASRHAEGKDQQRGIGFAGAVEASGRVLGELESLSDEHNKYDHEGKGGTLLSLAISGDSDEVLLSDIHDYECEDDEEMLGEVGEVSKGEVSKGEVSKEEVSKEEVSKEEVSKEEVSKEEVSKEEVSKEEVSKEEVTVDAVETADEEGAVIADDAISGVSGEQQPQVLEDGLAQCEEMEDEYATSNTPLNPSRKRRASSDANGDLAKKQRSLQEPAQQRCPAYLPSGQPCSKWRYPDSDATAWYCSDAHELQATGVINIRRKRRSRKRGQL